MMTGYISRGIYSDHIVSVCARSGILEPILKLELSVRSKQLDRSFFVETKSKLRGKHIKKKPPYKKAE